MFENETTKVFGIYLVINKEVYQFNDFLDKETGEIARKFIDGTIFTSNKFEIINVKNENKISPIKPIQEGEIKPFLGMTLDIETWLDEKLVQHLLSVAFYAGKNKKFYYILDYTNELELIEAVLNDILSFNGYNVYIHNGSRFDLIFLLNRIVELKDKLNLQFEVTYKEGEFLNINLSNGINSLAIKDSYKLLSASLSNLAKVFGISEEKGKFPFDFAKPQNFNYIGNTPDIKYFAFNDKSIINQEEYNSLVKTNWNFKEELAKYNINDCVVLYKVMEKFHNLIQNKFNLDMKNNPTLSSLAFSIYRSGFIPETLLTTTKISKGNKVYEIISSHIDSLNPKFDSYIRTGYFGGHVDSYIPYFTSTPTEPIIYQYDVVSLYPYVMKTFEMPYTIKSYIKGNILLTNRDLFESTLGFYKVRVISPISIINPILPYRSNTGVVLYPTGTWTGIYLSE
jgi:DNA polymerase elongation subunit (family B)